MNYVTPLIQDDLPRGEYLLAVRQNLFGDEQEPIVVIRLEIHGSTTLWRMEGKSLQPLRECSEYLVIGQVKGT